MNQDVIAVNIDSGIVRLVAQNKDERNADAIVCMAVMRRGVEEEYFVAVPAGMYNDGDKRDGARETAQEAAEAHARADAEEDEREYEREISKGPWPR